MSQPWLARAQKLTVALLTLLISACSTTPALSPAPVKPARIPQLPQEARQPKAPAWCSPTCSAGLTQRRENWRQRLTPPAPPASPASAPTTPSRDPESRLDK